MSSRHARSRLDNLNRSRVRMAEDLNRWLIGASEWDGRRDD
jgi:hypothetical protein